jgi:hypothetical protein
MEWVASTLHTTSEHGISSITTITTPDEHTSAASSRLNGSPTDLNGLVRFAERRHLVSARVPSHFKRSLLAASSQNSLFNRCTCRFRILYILTGYKGLRYKSQWRVYTECNRRNGPDFGRVYLRSNYTDITENTHIQS